MGGTNTTNTVHVVSENTLWAIEMEGLSLWLLFIGIMAALLAASVYVSSRNRRRLPPGPRGWPLLGNALDMPRQKEWLTFTEWKRTYGNIVSLSIAGQTIIILNSVKAAMDLLQRRSSIYSDRPRLVMSGELVGFDQSLVLAPYGDKFRQMRRLTHQVFSARPAEQFWPVQQQESVKFLDRLLQTPDQFIHHIRHTAGAIILKISHGYTVSESGSDPFVALAGKTLKSFSLSTTPGAFWVDILPWLKYVPSWCPGAGFRRTALKWRKDLSEMADSAHSFTKDQMAMGVAVPSFTSELLDSPYTPETEYLVKWTAASMYGGGVDTTVSAITSFFLAMCIYPKVQVTAQAELDSVVGRDRLPTMADRPLLPYINAILKEVLRWGPVTPLLLRRLIQDDEYEGYRIPAGSIVMPNIWAMTHDADIYPDPSEFCPDRFMMPNAQEPDPLQFSFGFGRRICPGQHLADASLFLSIAMTLAMFKISKAHDPISGDIIEPVVEWLPGSISHPKPFPCEIMPRSTQAVDVIQQANGGHGTLATSDAISL